MFYQEFIKQLLTIDKVLVNEWLNEYQEAKKEFFLNKWNNCIGHCGLFSEYTVGILKTMYSRVKINKNNIHFDAFYKELIKLPKSDPEDEIFLNAVTHATKTIYSIRNKKKGAHVKSLKPDYIDCMICMSLCDYVLAQFIMLKCSGDVKDVNSFIKSIIEKKIPFVEEFEDGSILLLDVKSKTNDEILVALYKKNIRITRNEIKKIIKPKYSQKFDSALRILKDKKQVHINEDGVKITKLGITKIESIINERSK